MTVEHADHVGLIRPRRLPAPRGVEVRAGGRFVLVEYDSDRGNPWVPYPLSWETWRDTAQRVGFRDTRLIGRVPSRFLGSIYAAVSNVGERPP